MIEKVLAPSNLYKAYRKVIQNKGSAGIDGMPTSDLQSYKDSNRTQLIHSILTRRYRTQAIKGVSIPKGNGKERLLGIPTVVDRWLQQAMHQELSAKFEYRFEANSYGFRPQKNVHQAVLQSLSYINEGYQDIVDIDLANFFDEVAHYKILQLVYNKVKCPITLWLIRKWLRAPLSKNGRLYKRRKGLPQGSPLSPLLSNILLDELDKHLKQAGLRYVRYADDFSIYTKSKSEARGVSKAVSKYLRERLGLPINESKSGICRPVRFEMLGYGFVSSYEKGAQGKYQLVAKKSSWTSLKRKLKYLTKKTLPMTLTERLERLSPIWLGWVNNYRLASIYSKLKQMDEWLRNRLRCCIWHDWKKPERKRKNLIRLGIDKEQAYAWSRTRMGSWAVAQSPILNTTITLSRLKRRGYSSMLDHYQKQRPQIR